jgi:hypothetical protein
MGTEAKEGNSITGHVWAAGFHHVTACSRLACVLELTWLDSIVRELIAIKVLLTLLLKTTVVTFIVLLLGSYAPMPAPSPPFTTILELGLWNGLQSHDCITPDVIIVIKMPSPTLHAKKRNESESLILGTMHSV